MRRPPFRSRVRFAIRGVRLLRAAHIPVRLFPLVRYLVIGLLS